MAQPQELATLIPNAASTSVSPTSNHNSITRAAIERYGTAENLLATFNPDNQIRFTRDLARAYRGDAPALVTITQGWGEGVTRAWLVAQLSDLDEYAGTRSKMNLRQTVQLAEIIMEQWGWLKVTELMHFFVQYKAGRYGHFYGTTDPLAITEAIRKFISDREGIIADIERKREHDQSEAARMLAEGYAREYKAARDRSGLNPDTFLDLWRQSPDIPAVEFAPIAWLFNIGFELRHISAETRRRIAASRAAV